MFGASERLRLSQELDLKEEDLLEVILIMYNTINHY
jgi:hypothetical protein